VKKLLAVVAAVLLIATPVYAYHTETQTPYDSSISINSNDGSITVSWQESDGYEDNPPEYYIVYIGLTESADDVSIQTTFGFTEALAWRSHTFTAEYLYTNLSVDNQNIYSKVKAFHDTNGTTSDFTPVKSVLYDYDYVPTTTTSSSTTTSSTTTTTTTSTTTTTTLPKAEDVVDDNVTTYLAWDEWGCEHPGNPLSFKQYLEAVESGEWFGYIPDDCSNKPIVDEVPEEVVEDVVEEILEDVEIPEEVIEEKAPEPTEEELAAIKAEEERLLQEQLDAEKEEEILLELEDSTIVEDLSEEEVEELVEAIKEIEETLEVIEIEEEVIELDIPEDIVTIIEEEVKDDNDVVLVVEDEPIEDVVEEQIEIIEDIVVEEITEEQIEVVSEIVEEVIENVEELTEEQVEVVAEVLKVETEDIAIIAEEAKEDVVIAEAVEVFVERAVENADVEDYTFADVVTEIQFENFIEDPIEVILDIDIGKIDITTIGDDMTQDQKEKAQEVVVPVILTRIVTMASFMFRRSV